VDALTVRQAAGIILARRVRELLSHERGARRGEDPEAVHQMRVGTRRLRAALRVFASYVRPKKRARRGLPWLARRLGRVRDHDVIIALLVERHLEQIHGDEGQRLEALVARFKERRFRAHQRLAGALKRGRYKKLRIALEELAARPRFGGSEDDMAARLLEEGIERLGAEVSSEPAMNLPAPSAEELHALRIAFKRLRYVLDFHAEIRGVAYEVERRLTRELQECLGELHDHDVLLGWLEEHGEWPVLHRRLAQDRARLLRRFRLLRRRWEERTRPEPSVAPLQEPRFVSLEPAPVELRLITPRKEVASTLIA
jgi:CHAD domain-containing protein